MNDVTALFDSLVDLQSQKRLPPVRAWQPEHVGHIDIRIASDGTWFHDGDPIVRQPLVDLFATVLRKDSDGYCLVTPAEKLFIRVEDAPFVAVDMEVKGEGADAEILFTTNVGDHVVVDDEHPLRVEDREGEPRPYVTVRDGLDALIARNVFYRLVELGRPEEGKLTVYSRGSRFLLGTL